MRQILFAATAILLALEVSARLYCFGWGAFSFRKVDSFHDLGRSGLLRSSADPDLQVELKPNLDTFFKTAHFATNSRGFRDREHALVRPTHVFRIVVLGASYAMGSGVDAADAVASVLESRLAASRPGAAYEVIVMAVGGYSPWQSATLLETQALAYQPDLVLFTTSPELYAERPRAAEPLRPAEHAFFDSYFVRLFDAAARATWRRVRGRQNHPDAAASAHVRGNLDDVFVRLERVQRAAGIPVCVAVLQHTNTALDLIPEMQASARAHDLRIVDATAPFARAGFPNACAHPLDCHPNAWAHRVFADAIFEFLIAHHLVDGPPRGARHGS